MDLLEQATLTDARQRLRWGFELRYAVGILGLAVFILSLFINGHPFYNLSLLALFLLGYNILAHLLYVPSHRRLTLLQLAILHIVLQLFDIGVITVLIYFTGLLESPYWFLYLVLIILSGFGSFSAYSYAVFFVAFFSMLFYLGLLVGAYGGLLPPYGATFTLTPQQLLLSIFNRAIYTTISFFLFAVTLFYFSKNLSRQKEALADQNRQLLQLIDELKVLSQMKDELITNVSHELRTPLSIVKEGLLMVRDGLAGTVNEKQREYLNNAKESIDRLTRIIANLLNIAKLENQSFEIFPQPVDIAKLACKIADSFLPKMAAAGLIFQCLPEKETIWALADADKIHEVFYNLIEDAVKFTPRGGRITVKIKEKAMDVECSVEDTGAGISPEDQKKLFKRFSRLNHEPGVKGIGLGLAICKGIVELHRGRIWVESAVGKGTKFFFTLPKGEQT
ncbi:HAMP domain-containing histidine kinase [Candidatus Saganbacteria bacterium]|nr:HAMP domain-containing histidine kinase [Candidatus Saganbacteria bacterium]